MGSQDVPVKKHVLYMDAEDESVHSLLLLLRIKGCLVAQASTTEEAINWISVRALVGKPLDLMVVDNFNLSRKNRRLLAELDRRRLSTPVLLVNRKGETVAIEMLLRKLVPDCPFTLCEPETVFEILDRFFVPKFY